jgi:hypothetical protein
MNRRITRIAFAGALVTGLTGLLASSAAATYHENFIREVHEGSGGTGDYVELQAYAAGQNLVAGKHIVSYDGGGGVLTNYIIPSNVSNGANQATILIAHDASTPGADFPAGTDLNVDNSGGTVCYTDGDTAVKLDCLAFQGTMNPTTLPPGAAFGAPFALPGLNLDNQSLIRTISRGCATALDTADDTNTAADFSLGAGNPRGNSVTPTETACPPTAPVTPTGSKKKCKKKHKKKTGASSAKKKKCKKHHRK